MTYRLSGGTAVRSLAGPVESADVFVVDDRIGRETNDAVRVDVSGCLVVPGNVCAHHHLYSALARGMPGPATPPRNFVEILERVWWRLDRALDPDTIGLSALLGSVEAAKAGTTTIVDHHASPEAIDSSLDVVADALAQAGVRGVVCYEVTDRHGEGRGRAGIDENVRFLRANNRELVRGMMGAHASFTIGPATLDGLVGAARDHDSPIHIHLAEDAVDERDCLKRYGLRTVPRLAKAGGLDEGDLVAHGVHLDDEEIETLRASAAWLAHNPRSNMNNGVGYAPVSRMGPRVALGTDGIDGDMFAEARACYLKAREADRRAGVTFPVERLAQGHAFAGTLFDEPALGRLEPGAPADLSVLEYRAPSPVATENLAGHLVFGLGSWLVRDVMIAGRWIVRDRRHELVDEEELYARCRQAAPKLWERMQAF